MADGGGWINLRMPLLGRMDLSGLPGNYTNEKDQEIIGVKDAALFWITNYGTGTNTVAGGGFTATTFDVTSYGDGAIVKLNNNSGGDRKMKACCIYGKPVVRYSGEKAAIHDEFVDYDSVTRDGEKKLEFGNNYVVTVSQLEQLCDYYWKANNYKRHVYELEIPGRCYWYSPGEWYTVQIGSAGDVEYIDSVCECYDVQVEGEAGGLGRTMVSFREIYQNWTKDSGALARFLGSGSPKDKFNFSRVLVASQYYPGPSDFRCDGTADQTEIQAAIDQVAGFGGGVVELTEGTFNISASLTMADKVCLRGASRNTIFAPNGDADTVVDINGADDVQLENFSIIPASSYAADGTNALIQNSNAATNLTINNVAIDDDSSTDSRGIRLLNNQNVIITNCYIDGISRQGILVSTVGSLLKISNNTVQNCGGAAISISGANSSIISDNHIYSCLLGISVSGDTTKITGNIIENCNYEVHPTADSNGCGIYCDGENNLIENNVLINNIYGIRTSAGSSGVQIKNNMSKDNGQSLDDGDCEAETQVFILGDAGSLSGCTFDRSTVEYYAGSYSHKVIQTDASTGEYRFCDNVTKNDLHGLYPNTQYKLSAYIYRLATGSPTTAEVKLIVGYTTDAAGAWHETTGNIATEADAWALAETTNVNLANAVGAKALIRINAAASTDEYIFIDNVRLQPVGTHNLHSQNFYDAGSNTYVGV